ncbi:hypothetical protein [Bacillus sp. AK128]
MSQYKGGITFRNINVNAQSSNAGVFIGNTESIGWKIREKQNVGFGETRNNKRGESPIRENVNLIFDDDVIDHYHEK